MVLGLRTENGVKDGNVRGNQLCFLERAKARKSTVMRGNVGLYIRDWTISAGISGKR